MMEVYNTLAALAGPGLATWTGGSAVCEKGRLPCQARLRTVNRQRPSCLPQALTRESQKPAAEGPSTSTPAQPLDPDLARVVNAWPTLPEPIRRAIRALIESALGE